MSDEDSKLVYSTEQEVPRKEKPEKKTVCTSLQPAQLKLTVRLDRKARAGKSVTLIEGLFIPQQEIEALLKQLKTKLGTGGTVKDTSLEIQGDHCGILIQVLEKMGYRTKRSG
ncbi:MAG: stress response translation initiation inhibitor YciH [Thermodesulfovibrionia bacterium]|nr:stress response translation initiation inhibitor YciH [Thermodesulfovibrionia bacterium]